MNEQTDIEIILSEPQTAVLASRAAVTLEMAGQGSGKSQTIGYHSGMMVSDFPQLVGFIGANTYMQLSQSTLVRVFTVWKETYGFTEYNQKNNPGGAYVVDRRPPPHFERIHVMRSYDGTISFYNGCLIYLASLDNYKAHDGKQFAWAHLDETKDTKEAALTEVIMGRLRQFGLWYHRDTLELEYSPDLSNEASAAAGLVSWNPLFIHTSPATNHVLWLNKMFMLPAYAKEIKAEVLKKEQGYFYKETGNKCIVIYSVHHNAHNLPPNYITNQIENLRDEDKILKQVYGYPFSKSGGEYFPEFRQDRHVRPVAFIPGVAVHLTWDFNVVPYMTCLACQIVFLLRFTDPAGNKFDAPGDDRRPLEVMQIRFYKEYTLENPRNSTDAVCDAFMQDHPAGTVEVFYYGDASGLSRIPGMGTLTNYRIITEKLFNYLHNDSKKVRAPNVGIFKRRDLVNDIFRGKYPEVEILIDEAECPNTVADMENVKLGPKGKLKKRDKDTGAEIDGHTSDALEYLISEVCKNYIQ